MYAARLKPGAKDIYDNDLTSLMNIEFDILEIHEDITYIKNHLSKVTLKVKTEYVEFVKMP